MRINRSCVGALLLLLVVPRLDAEPPGPIVILGALESETQPVAAVLGEREPIAVLGIPSLAGKLAGRTVILAATGVGKVNAAMTTALLVERFAPEAVIFTGIAGAIDPELHPGDVVVGDKLVQHDLVNHTEAGAVLRNVRNPRDGATNPIELWPSPRLLALARRAAAIGAIEPVQDESGPRVPRVHFGTIATGDSFVGSPKKKDELHAQLGADAVEMEGAAVGQVCHQLGVPFLVVRGLSDRAGSGARAEAQRNLGVTARNAAQIAVAVARLLAMEPAQDEP